MKTKELTYGGMLSALIVALTLFVRVTGIGYTTYLDFLLPIIIGTITLLCGFKCAGLCSGISALIIFMGMGDLPTALWMLQSTVIGLICGKAIMRNSTIMDDLLSCAIYGAIIIIFIDLYGEVILGGSFIK